jgi:hypothetical protein
MRKDVTICIGTVGYPTFDRCHSKVQEIAKADARVKDVVIIKDKYPTCAWLNEMRRSCKTTWCLQVDEDMYLNDNSIGILIGLAKRSEAAGIRVLNASGLLYDIFLKKRIGSLKLWRVDSFAHAEFKDVSGSDRQFAKDLKKFGFQNVEIHKVLGQHDSAPNPEIAYFKYKEYIMKIRKFEGERAAAGYLKRFKKICDQNNTIIAKFAYEGAVVGLSSPLSNRTKDYLKNMNNDEIGRVHQKVKGGIC